MSVGDSFDGALSDLQEKVQQVKNLTDSLPLSVDQRVELYTAIKNRNIMVSPNSLTKKQLERLNLEVRELYHRRDRAYGCARSLPATNDCDDYARADVTRAFEELFKGRII